MNRTPVLLNRILLGLIGLVSVALGLHLVLVSLLPAYADAVHPVLQNVGRWASQLWGSASPGATSLAWLLVAMPAVVLLVAALAWTLAQGRGRATVFHRDAVPTGEARGVVELGGAVPVALLKAALAQRTDLLSVSVSLWEERSEAAGLRIRLQPRAGSEPVRLVREIEGLVHQLDDRLGVQGPVLVEVVTGTRARFARTERVR